MRESDSFIRAQRQYDAQTPWDKESPEDYDAEKAQEEYEAAMDAKYDRLRDGE